MKEDIMQARTARLGWVTGTLIVAAVIATLSVTGYGLDALMLALLVSLLIGAYLTRRNVRAAVLYSRLAGGRPPPRTQGVQEPDVPGRRREATGPSPTRLSRVPDEQAVRVPAPRAHPHGASVRLER